MKGGLAIYATLTLIPVKPEMREKTEKVADNQFSATRGIKGIKSVTYFFNPDGNECGSFIVWDSKEAAEAAWAAQGPKIQEAMSEIATGAPVRRVFEVYEPKM